MPQIKLTYFDIAGRAELTRLAFAYGGVAFDDERIAGPVFAERKPTLPLGQLPVVSVDGVTYPQSMAMARYAGRLSGLYPTDPLQALKVDAVLETIVDLTNKFIEINWGTSDAAQKAEKTKTFVEETLPRSFRYLESLVQGKFFFGDSPTLADVEIFNSITNALGPNFPAFKTTPFPKIEAVAANVKALPAIATYLAAKK
ncbi:hypothetical protein P43SY_012040 [Pythium insidiosum]|uniref:Glutathione S-transferase n=1 Tax=Pythium insidiosum TaxID=114742 RepID=A0AAD5Q054_PYTIN|nr:hypothetical protein P43SY_012040 [Pythium insidiosum]KAJ0405839.1 hypothetical protein ATCC90586_001702 [Pythium insidiosum]